MGRKKTTAELVSERPSPEELAGLPRTPISVVVDNVRSLDNVGLIFRLCETARVERLYLTGYTGYPAVEKDTRPRAVIDRHQRRIEKTAVYALPHQPWEYVEDAVTLVSDLKAKGAHVVALEQTESSIPYHQADYTLPMVLVVGHERRGVRDELLALANEVVEIPILGLGNSHNVATATGIVLYRALEKTGLL